MVEARWPWCLSGSSHLSVPSSCQNNLAIKFGKLLRVEDSNSVRTGGMSAARHLPMAYRRPLLRSLAWGVPYRGPGCFFFCWGASQKGFPLFFGCETGNPEEPHLLRCCGIYLKPRPTSNLPYTQLPSGTLSCCAGRSAL